jgi:hypothetical protein
MKTAAVVTFGCVLLIIAFNVCLGGFATQYVVDFWGSYMTHKAVRVPLLPCAIAGLFLGEVSVPAAVVTWLISFVL